jgi:hypothetical protein
MYLFGSILWNLIGRVLVGEIQAVYTPLPLWLFALVTAIAAGAVLYSYRGYFLDRRISTAIAVHWTDCKRRFERDLSMARTADEVGKTIENFAKCWRSGFKNK